MIKVFFLSIFRAMDDVSIQTLRNEIVQLAESDSQLEFWFTGCHNSAEKTMIQLIKEIKALYPENQISIVSVIDPIKYEKFAWGDFDEVRVGVPSGTVTKLEYAPRIEGKSEQFLNRFVEHYRKIDRWIAEQCDIVFAFHYEGIPDYINQEVKRLKKKKTPKVISIYNPDVSKRINDYIDALEGREGIIAQGIRDGRTYKSLSDELGISTHRVQQLSHRAVRQMFSEIRKSIT